MLGGSNGLVFPRLETHYPASVVKPLRRLSWEKLSGKLPKAHQTEVDSYVFSISEDYLDEIHHLSRQARDEHLRRRHGLGTKVKSRLYATCVDYVYNAFFALADCLWDSGKQTWGHQHAHPLIASKMAYRFWISQHGMTHQDAMLYAYVSDLEAFAANFDEYDAFLKDIRVHDPFVKKEQPLAPPPRRVDTKKLIETVLHERGEVRWNDAGFLCNAFGREVRKFNRFGPDAAKGHIEITRKQPVLRFPTKLEEHPVSICIKGHESGLPPHFIKRLKELDFSDAPYVKYKLYPKFGNKCDEVGAARVLDIDTQTIFFDCTHVTPPDVKEEEPPYTGSYTFPECGFSASMLSDATASEAAREIYREFLARLSLYVVPTKRFVLRATPTDCEHRGTIEAAVHFRKRLVLDYSTIKWDEDAAWASATQSKPETPAAPKPAKKRAGKSKKKLDISDAIDIAKIAAALQRDDEDPLSGVAVTTGSAKMPNDRATVIRFASASGQEESPPNLGTYWKCDPCRVQTPMQDAIEERTGRACAWCAGQMTLVRPGKDR